jgi:succinate dehydrogenase/fumarate reductase flavoprotein subunit
MLPVALNFYRTADDLARSLTILDDIWRTIPPRAARRRRSASPLELVRPREAAALLACARWSLTSALARRETRGMHRRIDHPDTDPRAPERLVSRGLDQIEIEASAPVSEARG